MTQEPSADRLVSAVREPIPAAAVDMSLSGTHSAVNYALNLMHVWLYVDLVGALRRRLKS